MEEEEEGDKGEGEEEENTDLDKFPIGKKTWYAKLQESNEESA